MPIVHCRASALSKLHLNIKRGLPIGKFLSCSVSIDYFTSNYMMNSTASKMSTSDYIESGTSTSASSTLPNNTSTTGWYGRQSGLWCSVVSTLRSTSSQLRNETHSSHSKTSTFTTSSKTDKSVSFSSSSSCTETSDTWKYKDDNKSKTSNPGGHTYYNLIEDFPYGGFCGKSLASITNGEPSVGMIIGELFPEEEIFKEEEHQESIIPIQVLLNTVEPG